jgi:hypothetical protein
MSLREELEAAINRASAENGSNTPDFILAEYLLDTLAAFDKAVLERQSWWGQTTLFDNMHDEVQPPKD